MFFSLSVGDQASLAMSPLEYLRCYEEEPRLMDILSTIQRRVRWNMAKNMDKVKADAGKRHLPNSPSTQGRIKR